MTRRSPRELERAIEDIDTPEDGGPPDNLAEYMLWREGMDREPDLVIGAPPPGDDHA